MEHFSKDMFKENPNLFLNCLLKSNLKNNYQINKLLAMSVGVIQFSWSRRLANAGAVAAKNNKRPPLTICII